MKKLLLIGLFLLLASQFCFGVAATMYVVPAGAGDKSGSSWANAMSSTTWETDVETNAEPGDIYYVYTGTYSLDNDWSTALNGVSTAPITIIGCSDQGDPPTEANGNDRPLIDATAADYAFKFSNSWIIKNLRVTITDVDGFRCNDKGIRINCYAYNSSETANRRAFYCSGGGGRLINCEGISTNGVAVFLYSADCHAESCNFHDSATGIAISNNGCTAENNIIDTCTTGITFGFADNSGKICNNTIYNCTTGIAASDSAAIIVRNNIIDTCTTGINWTTEQKNNYFDYNNYYNNTSNMVNVTTGTSSTFLDPGFTDAPNGDFSIGENLSAKGFPGTFPGGLSVGYLDIGAVQREETGGGGSGSTETSYFIAP